MVEHDVVGCSTAGLIDQDVPPLLIQGGPRAATDAQMAQDDIVDAGLNLQAVPLDLDAVTGRRLARHGEVTHAGASDQDGAREGDRPPYRKDAGARPGVLHAI